MHFLISISKLIKRIVINIKKNYCGIDVSLETRDICYQTESGEKLHMQVKNNKSGYKKLRKTCGTNWHYVMENTGIYHTGLMFFLHDHQLTYSVVNALQIKRYVQMHLERNKSDKKMPDKEYFECRSLNNAIHDMTKDITKLSNHIHSTKRAPYQTNEILATYRSLLAKLRKEKQKLENSLHKALKAWQPELLELVQSVKGIGK